MFSSGVEEDTLGIETKVLKCRIKKNESNMIGITVDGGRPKCPCLYISTIIANSPVAIDGSMRSGDEIIAVNGLCVKGWHKARVLLLIRKTFEPEIEITYKKLIIDESRFNKMNLDMIIKKLKHRLAERMGPSAADSLGLSRAIIRNDPLTAKLISLNCLCKFYQRLIRLFINYECRSRSLFEAHRALGDALSDMGARDPQKSASSAFTRFGDAHRQVAKKEDGIVKVLHQSVDYLELFCRAVIPDVRMTLEKYSYAKFEYLSYCLKLSEFENDVDICRSFGEISIRLESGNYEYRAILNLRDAARQRFIDLRNDVTEKLELVDKKHVEGVSKNVRRLTETMVSMYSECGDLMEKCDELFPIEPDIPISTDKND